MSMILSIYCLTYAVAGQDLDASASYCFLGLPRNDVEKAAASHPPFSLLDPVGPAYTEDEKQSQRKAGEEVLAKLRAAKGNFTIPSGEYRFNCLQPILIEGLKDAVIEAAGATFWLDRPADKAAAECWGLRFQACRNVTVRGLTLDYDPPLYMQGRITAMDPAASTVDLLVDDGFLVVDCRPLQIIFFRENGDYIPQPPHFHDGVKAMDGRMLKVAIKTMDQIQAQSENPKILEAFDGRTRIGVGDYAVLPFRTGTALQVEQCANMVFEEVTLYAAPGFAFLESGGEGGHRYTRCKVIRRPGTRRLWAGNADAFHSRMLEKGARLECCEFAHIGDDFLNFHSFWHLTTYVYAQNRVVVLPQMYAPFQTGQTIEFFDQVSAASRGEAVITSIGPMEDAVVVEEASKAPEKYGFIHYQGRPVVLTLDRDTSAAPGSMVDARRWNSPGIVVKDCYFHDAMGRGALVEGVDNITMENNTWRDCNGGIEVFSCMWYYVEGPFSHGVVLRGNRFLNADATPWPVQQHQPVNGTICVTQVANGGNYPREVIHHRDVLIEDNIIYRSINYPVLVAYTRGAHIANNRIIEPRHYVSRIGYDQSPAYYMDAAGVANPACAIFVMRSEAVHVDGNTIEDPEKLLTSALGVGPGVTLVNDGGR